MQLIKFTWIYLYLLYTAWSHLIPFDGIKFIWINLNLILIYLINLNLLYTASSHLITFDGIKLVK